MVRTKPKPKPKPNIQTKQEWCEKGRALILQFFLKHFCGPRKHYGARVCMMVLGIVYDECGVDRNNMLIRIKKHLMTESPHDLSDEATSDNLSITQWVRQVICSRNMVKGPKSDPPIMTGFKGILIPNDLWAGKGSAAKAEIEGFY